jgi:hypothetical protein
MDATLYLGNALGRHSSLGVCAEDKELPKVMSPTLCRGWMHPSPGVFKEGSTKGAKFFVVSLTGRLPSLESAKKVARRELNFSLH